MFEDDEDEEFESKEFTFVKTNLQEPTMCNALRLAEYLESLPEDYKHFYMGDWFQSYADNDDWWAETYKLVRDDYDADESMEEKAEEANKAYVQGKMRTCGTAACAAGHGPAAGFPVPEKYWRRLYGQFHDINWADYARQTFIGNGSARWRGHVFDFWFGGGWAGTDDTPWGAAARIRYVLETGQVPIDHDYDDEMVKLYKQYETKEQVPLTKKHPGYIPEPVREKEPV